MTHAPLVSALVRSMDRPTLPRALASIAQQDYAAIEVIVVAANGSAHRDLPDRCGAFALRLVHGAQALARADAANAALAAASGELCNFLDDDDEWLPGHVAALASALAAQPTARLAYSRSEDCDAGGRIVRIHGEAFRPWRQLDTGFFRSQCALFARSLVDEGARFDARFDVLEDMDFFIQCAQRTPFAFVDRVTARYHAEAGASGAGVGANRDEARLAPAIAALRDKWRTLESRLHATPEFRCEQALWLLEHGKADLAARVVAALLGEYPDDADALALGAVLHAVNGDGVAARALVARTGAHELRVPELRRHFAALRERFARENG